VPICLAESGFTAWETQRAYDFLPVMKNEFESVTNEIERPANKSQVEISGFRSSEKGNTKSSR
jgi:hypothetical protein